MANGDTPICLTCERHAVRRGLCNNCYQSALAQIKRGVTTWNEAMDMGLAGPPRKYGPWVKRFRSLTGAGENDKSQAPQEGAKSAEPGLGNKANP